MAIGPKTSTKFEIRSGYEEEAAEKLGFANLEEYYKSLLTAGAKTAAQTAQTQYQTAAKTAAEQASYDISGAYANYLKQQRNIASQGRLEKGYKEEVSEALQTQYGTAYQQAKTTEAKSLASAAQQASELYEDIYTEAESRADTILKYYQQEAETKANLYKFIEEQAGYEESTLPWYVEGGKGLELTPYGQEQIRRYLLEDADLVTHGLEEAGLEDELSYYLSDAHKIRSELFGIEEDLYDYKSAASVSARTIDKTYTDEVFKNAMTSYSKGGTGGTYGEQVDALLSVYRNEYGLNDEELKDALLKGHSLSKAERDKMSVKEAFIAAEQSHAKKSGEFGALQTIHSALTQKAQKRKE